MLTDRTFDEILREEPTTHVETKKNRAMSLSARLERLVLLADQLDTDADALLNGAASDPRKVGEIVARMVETARVLRGVG
jgi:hypothetical protein